MLQTILRISYVEIVCCDKYHFPRNSYNNALNTNETHVIAYKPCIGMLKALFFDRPMGEVVTECSRIIRAPYSITVIMQT